MYLIMGLAGSGKGTQGELLAQKINYSYLSTGEYLRQYITEQRKQEMLAGKLIDDDEMIKIIESFLESQTDRTKTILDGFPRTLAQAEWLYKLHEQNKIEIEGVIYLKVPEEKLLERLLIRGRPDDTKQAIEKRFSEYKISTEPVLRFYKEKSIPLYEIDGDKDIKGVQQDILQQINKREK